MGIPSQGIQNAQSENVSKYVLGLDLGSASIGWALVRLNPEGTPDGLLTGAGFGGREVPACGVRIFEPGVQGTTLDILQGKDQSRAVDRRNARLQRRQIRRRVWRQAKLFRLLQAHHLLPTTDAGSEWAPSEQRHRILNRLDQQLSSKYRLADGPVADQVPLYRLRKRALDHRLEPEEFGRVLVHLSQRRGFKSNRKEAPKGKKADEDLGAVNADIRTLAEAIRDSGARTLGEYFAGVDPHVHRIRRRWTARGMYEAEFDLLWSVQAQFHREVLTESLRREVRPLLFFQRPIAAQSNLIGRCELEGPNFRRAPWAALEAQRFRIWQKVNDLRIIHPGIIEFEPLSLAQRALAYDRLDTAGDQSFAALRKLLKLPKGTTFNLERGDEKRLRGNRTNSQLREVFGARWAELPSDEQKEIVEGWRTSESDETLVRHGIERWGLDENAARLLADKKPEPGYCALSRRAISKLLPLMAAGQSFKEAETRIYGSRFSGGQVLDCLPPLRAHRKIVGNAATEAQLRALKLADLRNPAVERALTELRKVVNAIIRAHGKPYEIRIELARELKKPRRERQAATKANRDHEKERDALKSRLLRECGIQNPHAARRRAHELAREKIIS